MLNSGYSLLFGAGICSFVLVGTLTPVFRWLAWRWRVLDVPNGNLKAHCAPTPYLGGLAIYAGFWISVLIFSPPDLSIVGLFCAASLVTAVGLVDDLFQLSPGQKLVWQILAGVVLVRFGFSLKLFDGQFFLNNSISLFWILSLINAVNLVDVMDGLATTICFWASTSLLCYAFYFNQFDLAIMLIVLLAALVAFFIYNRPKATIYLGDAGSTLLGVLLAAVVLKLHWVSLPAWLPLRYLIGPILLGVPLLEGSFLILIRKIKKIPFYRGSRDHFSHFLKRRQWTEADILWFVTWYSAVLALYSALIAFSVLSISFLFIIGLGLVSLWVYVVFAKNGLIKP